MLKKIKPLKDSYKFDFSVVDIETNENGIPTDIGIYDGTNFYYFSDVKSAVAHILRVNGRFYAHAGMRFDYPILIREIFRQGHNFTISFAGSQGITISNDECILLDSYRLLPASLRSLSDSFDVETKKIHLDVMPWLLTHEERLEYLIADCKSLYQVVCKFWELIDENFGKFRSATLPGLGLKIWKSTIKNPVLKSESKKLVKYESQSYFGGLCWVDTDIIRTKLEGLKIYDVNSMYPYQMLGLYPYSYMGHWTRTFSPKELGLWRVKAKYTGKPPFTFDVNTRTVSDDGEFILDTDSVLYLMSREDSQVKVLDGYVYSLTDYIFKEFVDKVYALRKDVTKPALSYTAKILLNSLYGKFAEREKKRVISHTYPGSAEQLRCYDIGGCEVFDYKEDVEVHHRFVAISSFVTLRARLHLRKLADLGDCIYTDTDSVHFRHLETNLETSSLIGGVKLEYEGDATYIGKKIYQLHSANVTKCKGIPKKALEGLDFSDFPSERKFNFDSFTSLIDVLHYEDDFKLVQKTRTIR